MPAIHSGGDRWRFSKFILLGAVMGINSGHNFRATSTGERAETLIHHLFERNTSGDVDYQKCFIVTFREEPSPRKLVQIATLEKSLTLVSGWDFYLSGMRRGCFEVFYKMNAFNNKGAKAAEFRIARSVALREKLISFGVDRARFRNWIFRT